MAFLALYLIIIVGVVIVIFLISGIFPKIGKFIYRIGKDAKDIVNKEYEIENNKEEEEK